MFRFEWRVQYSKDVVSLLLHTYTLKDGIYYLQYCLAPEVCPRAAGPRTQAAPGYYHKFQICTNKHNRILHTVHDYKTLLVVCGGSLHLV